MVKCIYMVEKYSLYEEKVEEAKKILLELIENWRKASKLMVELLEKTKKIEEFLKRNPPNAETLKKLNELYLAQIERLEKEISHLLAVINSLLDYIERLKILDSLTDYPAGHA